MNKRTRRRNARNKRRIKRRKKRFFTMIFVVIFILAGSTTFKLINRSNSKAVAVSTDEVLSKMILNNPIKSGLNQEIKKIEEEKSKEKLNYMREAEREKQEAKRLKEEEERRLKEKELNKNKKIAYLTFDDGPSRNVTPRILDILKDYQVKATFFVLGNVAETNQDMLKRIHNEGHSIGHHSYSHNYNHIYSNSANFINELEKTNKVFENILGGEFETKLLRFPGGSFEKRKQGIVQETKALGYRNYDWNALNGDAEGHNLSKDALVNRLKSTIPSGSSGEKIILMHDTDAKKTTADALPEIIEYLIKEGYELRALKEK